VEGGTPQTPPLADAEVVGRDLVALLDEPVGHHEVASGGLRLARGLAGEGARVRPGQTGVGARVLVLAAVAGSRVRASVEAIRRAPGEIRAGRGLAPAFVETPRDELDLGGRAGHAMEARVYFHDERWLLVDRVRVLSAG
jgi:hypothetical protein